MVEPGKDAHPRLRELWDAVVSPRVVWRLHYNMPPNDPRVQDISEEEILDDLMILSYRVLREELERKPALTQASSEDRVDAWRKAQDAAEKGDDEVHNEHVARMKRALRGKGAMTEATTAPPVKAPAPTKGSRWAMPWGPRA